MCGANVPASILSSISNEDSGRDSINASAIFICRSVLELRPHPASSRHIAIIWRRYFITLTKYNWTVSYLECKIVLFSHIFTMLAKNGKDKMKIQYVSNPDLLPQTANNIDRMKFYSLDVIIFVSYRVKHIRGKFPTVPGITSGTE